MLMLSYALAKRKYMFIFANLNMFLMALINIPGELMKLIFGSLMKDSCDLDQISWFDCFLGLLVILASLYLLLMPLVIFYSRKTSNKKDSFPKEERIRSSFCSNCSKINAGVIIPAFFVSFCQSHFPFVIFGKIAFSIFSKKSHKCHKLVDVFDF